MLTVSGVSKSYSNDKSSSCIVLDKIYIDIHDNEFVCILGKSGCGKSTLLNIIAGYLKPDTGHVYVDGEEIDGPSQDRGVVFQEHGLFPWYTVKQNVAIGPKVNHKKNWREIADKFIKMVQMEEYADYFPQQLSGGMKQRVGIARAFANSPKILLMDEPFSALDPTTKSIMHHELLNIWEKEKTTIVFITHNIDEAVMLADKIVVLGAGNVIMEKKIDIPRENRTENPHFNDYVKEIDMCIQQSEAHIKGVN